MELRHQAEEERRIQNERIAQLEQIVQMQAQKNTKLHNMVDSHFAQARELWHVNENKLRDAPCAMRIASPWFF